MDPNLSFAENPAHRLCSPETDEYTLRAFVRLLSSIPADSDILLSAFEQNLSRKLWKTSPRSGDYYTPKSMIQWLVELLGMEYGGKVYDPCCGSGAMLFGAAHSLFDKKLKLYGQTLNQESFSICQTNLMLHDLSVDLGKNPANTLLEDMHANQQFDYILSNPPFNSSNWHENGCMNRDPRWQYGCPPRKNANFAWLQHIIHHLSPHGCAVTLLPNGTLTTQNLTERKIRQNILLDRWIEAIIALPQGVFSRTKVSCCVWVINQAAARDTVLFIDARQMNVKSQQGGKKISNLLYRYRNGEQLERTEWYAAASHSEIARNSYILSPNLYTRRKELSVPSFKQISEDFNTQADTLCSRIPSSSLCKNIKDWMSKSLPAGWEEVDLLKQYSVLGGVSAAKAAFGQGIPMADVTTVIHNVFLPDTFPSCVKLSNAAASKYNIQCGDVLLNRTSETIDELACCSVALKDQDAVYGGFLKMPGPTPGIWRGTFAAGYIDKKLNGFLTFIQPVRISTCISFQRYGYILPAWRGSKQLGKPCLL